MTRIRFEDLPSTNTPRNAENLNKLNNVVISPTEPTTGEEVWIQKSKNLFNINGSYIQQTGSPTISGNSISLPSSEGNGGYTKFEQKIEVNSPIVLSFVTSNGSGYARPLLMPLDSDGNIITDLTIDGYTYLNGYGGYFKDLPDGNYELILNFPENVKYFQLGFIHINATFTNIQIERGKTATDYEPYVEKKIYCKNDNGVYEEFYPEEEPQWINIPYENGYSSLDENSWNKLQYKQKGKQVFLRGMIKNSNANPSGANATCGILPVGARPMKGLYLAGSQGDETVRHIDVVVNNNGQIQVYNTVANTWLSLDGLSFFID